MTKQKTVLFTVDQLHVGGITAFVRQYAAALTDGGWNVVILGFIGNLPNPEFFFHGSKIVMIPEAIQWSFFDRIRRINSYIKYLRIIFSTYDVKVVHFSTNWSTFYTLLYPPVWKRKRVATFYGAYDLEMMSMIGTSPLKIKDIVSARLRWFAQQLLIIQANTIIVFSKYAKRLLYSHFHVSQRKQVVTIPGFVLESGADLRFMKGHLPRKRTNQVILNIGRSEIRKGAMVLLESLAALKRQKVRFKAYIASPVEYYSWSGVFEKYQQLNLLTQVHLLHTADNPQQKMLFADADVFVMPSVDLETFGMTIIESLSNGVPVIGSDAGAIPEILSHVDRRLIIHNITPRRLADRIIWFFNLPNKEKNLIRKKSIEAVQNHYMFHAWKHKVQQLYAFL